MSRQGPQPGTLRIAQVIESTLAEGPGARFALWVQGCRIRCEGCCNPHLFDALGGTSTPIRELTARLASAREGLEGVTLLGGEPFEQAAALAAFATAAQDLGLGVMTFTGFVLEDLRASPDPGVRDLLGATDLLVDGPFDARRPERRRRWAGSANQRFHFLTARYTPGLEIIRPGEVARTVEVRIEPGTDGILVNGWPELARPWGQSTSGRRASARRPSRRRA